MKVLIVVELFLNEVTKRTVFSKLFWLMIMWRIDVDGMSRIINLFVIVIVEDERSFLYVILFIFT